MILERLIDTLNYGLESQQAWALLILKTLFEVPGLDLGQDCQVVADPNLTHPLIALLETERSHHALQVCMKMCMLAPLLAIWRLCEQVPQLWMNLVCTLRSCPHADQLTLQGLGRRMVFIHRALNCVQDISWGILAAGP